jgi:hypothetical protein
MPPRASPTRPPARFGSSAYAAPAWRADVGAGAGDPVRTDGSASGLPGRVAQAGVDGGGAPLPGRAALERSFGVGLGDVRVHAGPRASAACELLGAEAYAVGADVAVRRQPTPWLLAHEVAHTLQQRAAGSGGAPAHALEAEASGAASAAAAGKPARVQWQAPAGVPQRFSMTADQQTAYPRMTAYVRDQMPKAVNAEWLLKAVNDAARNTGPKARDPAADLAWGAGPKLLVKPLRKAESGKHAEGSDTLQVSKERVEGFENEKDAAMVPGHELWLETTLLHEYVHFVADKNEPANEEWGREFEQKAYGQMVGDAKSNVTNILNPRFSRGEFTVAVEGKEAAFKQRFVIAGADGGDGTYEWKAGIADVSVTKTGVAPLWWTVTIEHDDGTGWKRSSARRSIVSETEWLIRSEDFTDRDFNDLVLRVKKK